MGEVGTDTLIDRASQVHKGLSNKLYHRKGCSCPHLTDRETGATEACIIGNGHTGPGSIGLPPPTGYILSEAAFLDTSTQRRTGTQNNDSPRITASWRQSPQFKCHPLWSSCSLVFSHLQNWGGVGWRGGACEHKDGCVQYIMNTSIALSAAPSTELDGTLTCNPRTLEAKTEGLLQVGGQAVYA